MLDISFYLHHLVTAIRRSSLLKMIIFKMFLTLMFLNVVSLRYFTKHFNEKRSQPLIESGQVRKIMISRCESISRMSLIESVFIFHP